ncbi:hypothetical protein [Georgenia yuyongxinii]
MGAAATVAALALAGVPPLALWVTKDWAMAGAGGALRVVALAGAALSAVYAGKMLAVVLGPPRPAAAAATNAGAARGETRAGTLRVPAATTAVAWTLALVAAGLGALGLPAVAARLTGLVPAPGQPVPGLGELALPGVVAVVVLVVVLARPALLEPLGRGVLARWAGLPALLTPRPWLALARAVAVLDDRVIDRGVLGVAAVGKRLARAVGRADEVVLDGAVDGVASAGRRAAADVWVLDDRLVDGGVLGLAGALRRLGGTMRRPQTGLLHHYYAQALGGLGALLVLLLLVR